MRRVALKLRVAMNTRFGRDSAPTPRSPNLNAFAERFVRSIKEECLGRMIFFSERQLQTAVSEHVEHYHTERNHQGLANRLIEPAAEAASGRERSSENRGSGVY